MLLLIYTHPVGSAMRFWLSTSAKEQLKRLEKAENREKGDWKGEMCSRKGKDKQTGREMTEAYKSGVLGDVNRELV